MGVVYVGRHETLGRRVVVKVLQPHMSRQSDMLQRFFNEAQAATAINNPGIAQVFDFGMTPDGRAYFVMELLEGETLAARLKHGPLEPDECCRIGRQIANVLQAAHEAGITHRDLKPDNLFLVADREVIGGERVKVLDFGLAKLANEARPVKTRTGLVMGTPSYMSPEQCRGISNADARSDIYALGCILFKMACGRAPFVGDGPAEVIVAHVNEAVPDPRQLAPRLPPALSTLIKKMLAKNPSSRPQTMAAVSEAFDEILSTLSGAGARPRTATPPAPAPAPALAPAPAIPEDPPSLTVADSIPSITLDDTVRTPAALPTSEALATTQVPAPAARSPEPQAVSTSELAGAAEPSRIPRLRMPMFPFVLAGLIVAGVGITVAVVLSAGSSRSSERPSAGGEGAIEAPAPAPAKGAAGELEARCQGYQTARQWAELERCADELKPLDPERAAGLKLRAAQELGAASRAAAVEAALRDGNLKRAKAELEYIRPESAEHPDITRKYALAEEQAIGDLAAELARVKDGSCKKYSALLEKERALKPARVTEEAARRTPCAPPAKCNAEALAREGRSQADAGQLDAALTSYEAAYACNPVPTRALRPVTLACTSRNLAKARSYWKQLTPMMRSQTIGICVKNGISAAALNAP